MAKAKTPDDMEGITFKWMQIANAVAQGRMAPEEGMAKLQALATAHPDDRDWLEEEAETIRRQFGLDVAERIYAGHGSYWDKLRAVINALLDDRLDHERALELLASIDSQHPEHNDQTARLVSGISDSPLRRMSQKDD